MASPAAHTTTTISCSCILDKLSAWRHPDNVNAQTIFKYNTAATISNGSLLATIASLAFACFSNYALFGVIIAALSGIGYLMTKTVASETLKNLEIPLGWKPVQFQIGGECIQWLRCFPSATQPQAGDAQPRNIPNPFAGFRGFDRDQKHSAS